MTKIIGLTGGIGSGKSTVARFFEQLGVPVYYADEGAKEVMKSPEITAGLKAIFGDSVFVDGSLDRKKLAGVVFSDPEKLKRLNELVHPAVRHHFNTWLEDRSGEPLAIREAAILFESGTYKDCDKIILVTAPLELRIQRVMKRDGASREQVMSRVESQWPDDKKMALSDFTIENIDVEQSRREVNKIFKTLKKL